MVHVWIGRSMGYKAFDLEFNDDSFPINIRQIFAHEDVQNNSWVRTNTRAEKDVNEIIESVSIRKGGSDSYDPFEESYDDKVIEQRDEINIVLK